MQNKFADGSHSCLEESHRWAKVLLESGLDIDVVLQDGLFMTDGDVDASAGHTWLSVDGCIFDPTAAQFDGEVDASFYEIHEYVDGDALLERLRQYGIAVEKPAANANSPAGM